MKGNVCGGFNCTGFDVSKLTKKGDFTKKIKKLTGCHCPYFINKQNSGTRIKKLFSDKFCKKTNHQKICNAFCGKTKTKSCSIKTYSYKNSTNEDVTCKCKENYEVNPNTGKCQQQKITCGIAEDFTWEANYSDGCNCHPLIVGTNVTVATTVRALHGKNCEKRKTDIDNLCEISCNTSRGNTCDLTANPKEKNYFLKCTCKKPISKITNKKVNLFNNKVRCSEKTFEWHFCKDYCPRLNGSRRIRSCKLKKGIKVDNWIDKGDFDCKYHEEARTGKKPAKITTVEHTVEVVPIQDVEKVVSAEKTTKPPNPSCWNPPDKCDAWYQSRPIHLKNLANNLNEQLWFQPAVCDKQTPHILFTPKFCKDHSCDSGRCCFKHELYREKFQSPPFYR